MYFEFVVIFVVSISLLFATDVTYHMLQIDVYSELVLIEEIFGAEFAKGVHKSDVSELINISLLKMAVESFVGV